MCKVQWRHGALGGMTETSQRVDEGDVMFRIGYVSEEEICGSHTSAQVQGKFKCR